MVKEYEIVYMVDCDIVKFRFNAQENLDICHQWELAYYSEYDTDFSGTIIYIKGIDNDFWFDGVCDYFDDLTSKRIISLLV